MLWLLRLAKTALFGGGLFMVAMTNLVPAGFAQSVLVHDPIRSAAEGADIPIAVRADGPGVRIMMMQVYFKQPEETSYRHRDMLPDLNRWLGKIPGNEVRGGGLHYFISALLDDETVLTYPPQNPYKNPEEILIRASTAVETDAALKNPAQSASDAALPLFTASPSAPNPVPSDASPLEILAPAPDEALLPADLVIAISLMASNQEVDSSSVRIFLDGADVTRKSQISAALATLEPGELKPGRHRLRVTAKDSAGQSIPVVAVAFSILGAGEQSAAAKNKFRAHVFSDLRKEQIYESDQSFALGGVDFSGEFGGLDYQGTALVSSLEDKHYQPRNRFSLGVRSKWLGLSAGDVYPQMNDLIINGKRIRGLSGFVHLGFINLDWAMGESNRAVEGVSNIFKTASGQDSLRISRYGTFTQNLLAFRPSFGSGRNFQLGFTLAKIKDDIGSIRYGAMPKDNLVLGPDLRLAFDGGRITLTAAGALSFLTLDTSPGPMTSEDLKEAFGSDTDVPLNPADFEKYFVINESTTPLDPRDGSSMSYNIALKLNYWHNYLTVGYKSIGAEYTSLANPWLRKDLEGLYFSDRIRLLKNKVFFTLGYEDFQDNYANLYNNPSLSLKTFNYSLNYYPGQGLPTFTIGLRDHYRDNGIDRLTSQTLNYGGADSTFSVDNRERQLYRDFNAQIGYGLRLFERDHSLNISYISSQNMDKYNSSRLAGAVSNEIATTIQMISLTSQISVPMKATLSYASNSTRSGFGLGNFGYNYVGLGSEYRFLQPHITAFADIQISSISMPMAASQNADWSRNQYRLGASWQIAARHTLLLDLNLISNSDQQLAGGSKLKGYTDKILRLRYDKYF